MELASSTGGAAAREPPARPQRAAPTAATGVALLLQPWACSPDAAADACDAWRSASCACALIAPAPLCAAEPSGKPAGRDGGGKDRFARRKIFGVDVPFAAHAAVSQ
jgi:hypothetical protein